MLKKLALAALLAAGSSVAMADNDVGCGVGTQVWAGQKGVVPKILAATTNGIFTNQLLGITFGTLGCRQGGTVTAQVVTFTNENAEALARDMAVGQGERHCCKVSDEAAFCLIQRPYISKTLLTRRISPRGSP